MELYFVKKFISQTERTSTTCDACLEAGLFKTREEALAECKKKAERIFEWAKRAGKQDVTLFEGSMGNWCVEYKEASQDKFHTFWNYYADVTYINE